MEVRMRWLSLLLVLAACHERTDAPAVSKPQTPAAPARTIGAQLAAEARARPAGARRAEEVFAALGGAGLKLETPRQYVARTVAASYCLGSRTEAGLAVAVCEYPDAEAARQGRTRMETRFPMKDREILVVGQDTFTLTNLGRSGDDARRVASLVAARP
jgi:hypothetical protein